MSVQLKIRDGWRVCKLAAFPADRPSALFSLYTCVINGGLLVWSFSTAVSTTCTTAPGGWMYCGIVICFVNMTFSIAEMALMRSMIARGIPLGMSYTRLFLLTPLTLAFLLFIVWELVWMIAASRSFGRGSSDPCARHIPVQIGFLFFYLLLGTPLFLFTFATEAWRLPRWRRYASIAPEDRDIVAAEVVPPDTDDSGAGLSGRHAAGEPVRPGGGGGGRNAENTEMTSVVDYASIMDDMTTTMSPMRDERGGR